MNRVEIVNLAGRAYHMEREGAEAIDAWLLAARESLSGDPDRDELLLDFERAIGEKCAAYLTPARDVVLTSEVANVLESLGTIEPVGDQGMPDSAAVGAAGASDNSSTPPRSEPQVQQRGKLYRLRSEGMIAGVAAGLAARYRTDVTVVRVAWVVIPILLAGFTAGMSLLLAIPLYALLAFIVPNADSPDDRAAARGVGVTAQDRVREVRSASTPALSQLGRGLGEVIRFVARISRFALLIVITALLVAWVVAAGWLGVAGEDVRNGFGPDVSPWLVPLFLTCMAVVLIAPLGGVLAVLDFGLRERARRQANRLALWLLGATAAWVAAAALAVVVVLTVPGVRDIADDGRGRLLFMDTTYCFVRVESEDSHCRAGDEIVVMDDRDYEYRGGPFEHDPRRGLPATPGTPALPETPRIR